MCLTACLMKRAVYAGVDFDSQACEGEISIQTAELVDSLGSYVETSVSGSGLHVILKARPLASGISHRGIELYTDKRFFTMTGCTDDVPQPVVPAAAAFAALAKELQAESKGTRSGKIDEQGVQRNNVVQFTVPEWAVKQRPPAALAQLPLDDCLSDGLGANIDEIRSAVSAFLHRRLEQNQTG